MPKLKTRDVITAEADRLFYEKGYEATSFADIAEAVRISRGNFYYHFRTKDEILKAVIEKRKSDRVKLLAAWEAQRSPKERIIAFIQILITNQTKIMAFGCPIGTLATELAKLDPQPGMMRPACSMCFERGSKSSFSIWVSALTPMILQCTF